MRDDTQLTQEERYQIEALLKMGHHQSGIATVLKRHKSTISREVRRNRGSSWLPPEAGEHLTLARREAKAKPRVAPGTWEPAVRGVESGASQWLAVDGAGTACQSRMDLPVCLCGQAPWR